MSKIEDIIGLNDYNVTMSNKLIRASHSLSLVEKRCVAAIIAKIDSRRGSSSHAHLVEYKKISLTAIDYADTYSIDIKSAYRDLQKAADNLFERKVSIKSLTPKGQEIVTKFRWVSSATYAKSLGYVELSFTEEIYPHLNALGREFKQYKLKNASSFRSVYSWRLFEYANSWLEYCTANNKRVSVTIDNLREMLDAPKSYSYKDFRVRALEPAIKEIKTTSNIEISYDTKKKGRAIHSLNIFVKLSDQLELVLEKPKKDTFKKLILDVDNFLEGETVYQARQKQKPDRLGTHDTTWANDLKEEELF
jgi:plasmid replication initiation protein